MLTPLVAATFDVRLVCSACSVVRLLDVAALCCACEVTMKLAKPAKDVAELHGANNLTKQTALSEKGDVINGRGDTPNRHDVLTGSQPDGTAFAAGEDRTCKNWTSSTQGSAMLGHSDRIGLRDDDASKSWNSSHPSRGPDGGCSQADLRSTGGDGLLYCFAAN